MSVSIKDTNKRDLKLKGVRLVDGKLLDGDVEIDLIVLLNKLFGDNTEFDISATIKSEDEIDAEELNELSED